MDHSKEYTSEYLTVFRKHVVIPAFACIGAALVSPTVEADPVMLEYKYVPGQEFIIKGTSTVTVTEKWKGIERPQVSAGRPRNQKSSFVAVQDVDQVDGDGVATLNTKIRSLRVESEEIDGLFVTTIDENGIKVVVDGVTVTDTARPGSAGKPGDGQQLIEQLVKDTTTIKMGRDGTVANVDRGPVAAVAGLAARGGQSPVLSSVSFPGKPVSVGDTWEISRDMAELLGAPADDGKFTSKCTLESVEDTGAGKRAKIKQDVRIRLNGWNPKGKDTEPNNSMRIDGLRVDAVIRVTFDLDAGLVVESKIDLNEHREMLVDADNARPPGAAPSKNRIRLVTDTHMVGTVTVNPST